MAILLQTQTGTHRLFVEIADDEASRSRGLQGRQHLDDDQGMLFVSPQAVPVAFWMKDTPLSLDMMFFDADQRLVQIAENTEPFSLEFVPSRVPVRYVLEMKAGSARALGMGRGTRLVFPAP